MSEMSDNTKEFTAEIQRAIAGCITPDDVVVVRRPLGFPACHMESDGTSTEPKRCLTVTQPKKFYRGNRLFVIPAALGVVCVEDLRIGDESQLCASEPVPAEMFSPMSFGADMNLDTCSPNMLIMLTCINIDKPAVTVTSGLVGGLVFSRAEREQENRVMAELAKQIAKENTEGTGKTDVERLAEVKAEDEKWFAEVKAEKEKRRGEPTSK